MVLSLCRNTIIKSYRGFVHFNLKLFFKFVMSSLFLNGFIKNYEIHFDFTLVLFPYNIQGQTLLYR